MQFAKCFDEIPLAKCSLGIKNEKGYKKISLYGSKLTVFVPCKLILEPAFTAETAGWARDFPVRQGKFSQESLRLFQENLTRHGGKRPGQTVN